MDVSDREWNDVWAALGLPAPARDGPCWCNGPYPRDDMHHVWCRRRRWLFRRLVREGRAKAEAEERNLSPEWMHSDSR